MTWRIEANLDRDLAPRDAAMIQRCEVGIAESPGISGPRYATFQHGEGVCGAPASLTGAGALQPVELVHHGHRNKQMHGLFADAENGPEVDLLQLLRMVHVHARVGNGEHGGRPSLDER